MYAGNGDLGVGYTMPHSMRIPPGAVENALVVKDGHVVVMGGKGDWVACSEAGKLRLKIVGLTDEIGDANSTGEDCVVVELEVVMEDGSGAYEYI